MARITNKYIREELRKGFIPGQAVISEALRRYFDSHRVCVKGSFNWNHRVEGFYRSRGGKVGVSIYWQGDLTDGTDSIDLSEFVSHKTVTIPAESDFDGSRTYYRHDDICVTRESVEEAMKMLADLLENKAKRKKKDE